MRQAIGGLRVAWVLGASILAAASATSNPPPQVTPATQPAQYPQQQPQYAQPQPQYGSCEYACGQVARCQLAPYEGCVYECRRTGTEQQPNGRQDLDTIARSTCEQLSAAQAGASASATAPQPPPAATQPAAPPPYVAPTAPTAPAQSGGWRSPDHVSYTNPAMVSADFYLEATLGADGGFQGSWARYVCFAGAYGIMSCGKGQVEGRASGRLDANGTGSIDLERLGRSALTWSQKSSNEIAIELPRTWQGENVLFRSTLKR